MIFTLLACLVSCLLGYMFNYVETSILRLENKELKLKIERMRK